MSPSRSIEVLRRSRVGLLTTYRRNGEPVATPVSIAVRAGGVYFVTSATSGKARRLAVRRDVTLAPATVRGTVTGPATHGQARLLSQAERRRVRRLRATGWPSVLELPALPDPRAPDAGVRSPLRRTGRASSAGGTPPTVSTAQVYRAVQLTARTSALLFAAAQATSALGPRAAQASRTLYVAFMAAHAVHFAVVARYAVVNGGRDLFPGGRSLHDVGWLAHGGRHLHLLRRPGRHRLGHGRATGGRPATVAPDRPRSPPGSWPPCSSASISGSSHDRGGTRCPPPPWPGP